MRNNHNAFKHTERFHKSELNYYNQDLKVHGHNRPKRSQGFNLALG